MQNHYRKLYSIKCLFYLSFKVKLQFFKTFITPYFDFCSTILLYFPKTTIQKIFNSYNYCLTKLLGIKANSSMINNPNEFNNLLEKYGLNNFQHRFILRASTLAHNIVNKANSPKTLKEKLVFNKDIDKGYTLRNENQIKQVIKLKNHYGESTFEYIYCKLINNLLLNDIKTDIKLFTNRIFNNINLHFEKFILLFPKMDLKYKI